MGYTTAVTDRVLSDVTTPTSKGYMNVVDWTRIYNNARLTSALAAIELGTPVLFNPVTAPTTSTTEGIYTMFNTLLANIERLRLAVAGESITGTTTEIKDDWTPGINEDVFDYTDVNLWESTVDAIWTHYGGPDLTGPLTLSGDLTVDVGVTLIVVDYIDPNGHSITVNGTLYII